MCGAEPCVVNGRQMTAHQPTTFTRGCLSVPHWARPLYAYITQTLGKSYPTGDLTVGLAPKSQPHSTSRNTRVLCIGRRACRGLPVLAGCSGPSLWQLYTPDKAVMGQPWSIQPREADSTACCLRRLPLPPLGPASTGARLWTFMLTLLRPVYIRAGERGNGGRGCIWVILSVLCCTVAWCTCICSLIIRVVSRCQCTSPLRVSRLLPQFGGPHAVGLKIHIAEFEQKSTLFT